MNPKFSLVALLFALMFNQSITAQQQLNRTLFHNGNTRNYTLYIPASYNSSSPVPLLFNFHGGNGDIASQISVSDMRPIADTAGFILVYPQALADPNDGGSTNWTHKPPTTHNDIYFVEAMIDTLAKEFSIEANRVYACGYSNGGEFAFELSCGLSNHITAIGVVARSMYVDTYNQCAPMHPTAVLTIHGTKDDYNGIVFVGVTYYVALDSVNSYWSQYNNTDPSPTVFQLPDVNSTDGSTVEEYTWHNGDGCVKVKHLKVINGGHDWPGTFGNMDIDASKEIWSFVSKYDKGGLIGCAITSVDETPNDHGKIRVYPNPAIDKINIEVDGKDNFEYKIYSIDGEELLSGGGNEVDITNLPSGMYLLKVQGLTLKLLKKGK